jgi:hypothetical protein
MMRNARYRNLDSCVLNPSAARIGIGFEFGRRSRAMLCCGEHHSRRLAHQQAIEGGAFDDKPPRPAFDDTMCDHISWNMACRRRTATRALLRAACTAPELVMAPFPLSQRPMVAAATDILIWSANRGTVAGNRCTPDLLAIRIDQPDRIWCNGSVRPDVRHYAGEK